MWSATHAAAAEPLAGERAEAASELTDTYRLGSRQVEGGQHPDRFDALAGSADSEVAALGQLLVERKERRAKIEADVAKLQEYQANAVKKMQGAIRGYLFREVFGPERSTGEKLRDIAGRTKEPVGDTLAVQQELYQLGLKELKHEQKVRAKMRDLRAPLTPTEDADMAFFRRLPARRQAARTCRHEPQKPRATNIAPRAGAGRAGLQV